LMKSDVDSNVREVGADSAVAEEASSP
jgi:hypothetical protein